jgi:hypothetical protein
MATPGTPMAATQLSLLVSYNILLMAATRDTLCQVCATATLNLLLLLLPHQHITLCHDLQAFVEQATHAFAEHSSALATSAYCCTPATLQCELALRSACTVETANSSCVEPYAFACHQACQHQNFITKTWLLFLQESCSYFGQRTGYGLY